MKLVAVAALLAAPLLAACPKPRTSAATQPSPLAFDATKSDPKAIEVVDAGMAALGGYDKWETLKELRFSSVIMVDGEAKSIHEHAWDRWNGRHYYAETDMSTAKGKPDEIRVTEVKHDLFDRDKTPWAAYGGGELLRADGTKAAANARVQLTADLYFLAMIYKVKDPGVILALDNAEVHAPDDVTACKPSCTSIKITFEKGVGTDTWFLNYNNETKLPEVVEQQRGAGRLGYQLQDWTDAGGLKWPGKLQNIGLKGEVILFDGIKVGDPDDNRYEVQVR